MLRPLRVVITNLPEAHFEEVEGKVGRIPPRFPLDSPWIPLDSGPAPSRRALGQGPAGRPAAPRLPTL